MALWRVPLPWKWNTQVRRLTGLERRSSRRLGSQVHNWVSEGRYRVDYRYGPGVDLGYARVSTAKQDLDRQLPATHSSRPPTAVPRSPSGRPNPEADDLARFDTATDNGVQ